MSDFFLGEIRLFPYNWAPQDWHLCDGSLLKIQNYAGLYSLLRTTYGGDGKTTFGLPDLRGRTIVSQDWNSSSSDYVRGKSGGVEGVALTIQQIPLHNHYVNAVDSSGDIPSPTNNFIATPVKAGKGMTSVPALFARMGSAPITLNPGTVAPGAGAVPHNNMQPFLVMNYCIAVAGIYPPRD